MTAITEGMTTAAFILAMNANFAELKYEATTITQLTEKTAMSVIGTNFDAIESATISAPLIEDITAGISGADFNTRVNGNQNRYYSDSMTFSVGVGKNFTTINNAITRSISGNTIVIDEGTFAEKLNLTAKALNFVGSGTLGTILYYSETGNSATTYPTLSISQNSNFTNIYIRRKSNNQSANAEIMTISGGTVVFNACKVLLNTDDYIGVIPKFKVAAISGGAVVDFNGSIECLFLIGENILVTGSTFTFTGDQFKARILSKTASIVNITCENSHIFNGDYPAFNVEDTSTLNLNTTVEQIALDNATNAVIDAGANLIKTADIKGSSFFKLSGNFAGSIYINDATAATVLLKDVTATKGRTWVTTTGTGDSNTKVTFDNANIYMDFDNKVSGFHIIEDNKSADWEIINGSILEFSGYNGDYETMGNPVVLYGENATLKIRDSQIIDNVNDNAEPYPNNYPYTIALRNSFDFENVIITNQNKTGTCESTCIRLAKAVGQHIQCRLKNVTFNNSEVDKSPINFVSGGQVIDADDYICAENVTNNTTKAIFSFDNTPDLASWNTLTSQCPV